VVGGEWHLLASGSTERWRVTTDSPSVRTGPTFWDLQSRGVVGGPGCDDCRLDGRTNTAWRLSIARALPVGSTLHQFTVGVEHSTGEIETSASGFDLLASRFMSRGGALVPVLDSNGSAWLIRHRAAPPLEHSATGVLVSDEWRPSSTLTVHAGIRWDRQKLETDGLGSPIAARNGLSPRVSASWRLPGEVGWTLFAGLARYESDLLDLVDQRLEPVGEWFEYRGPAIDADAGVDRAFEEALQWLQASGSAPQFTGNEVARRAIEDRRWSRLGPTAEVTFGTSRRIGSELQARADVIWRRRGALEGGGAFVSSGVPRLIERASAADLGWLATRYTAMNLQLDYHLGVRADLGARYTLSRLSAVRDSDVNVPDGLAPEGDLAGDRRHRLRLWTYVALFESEEQGTAAVTMLQTVESGAPFGAVSWIDIGPWIGADGPRFAPYHFTGRDQFRGKTATRTDLSMKYSKVIPGTLRSELVVGFDVFNLFGRRRVIDPDGLVVARTALSDADRFSPFNPFADRPQPGVHWDTDPRFLAAAERAAMSVPRAYRATVAVRF
jgi:outer membrane receptor protein involved in Fe transport